jgi:methoxymalonate biosynthesis protein
MTRTLNSVGIVGAGVMGSGIATLLVIRGVDAVLLDADTEVLARVPNTIRRNRMEARLNRSVPSDEQVPAKGTVTTATSYDALTDVDLVIEAVFERTPLKLEVLASISEHVAQDVPILSNTSCIPADELARAVRNPTRFALAHAMNPPYLMPGIELAGCADTAPDLVSQLATTFADHLALRPFIVHGAEAGLLVNSILQLEIAEAIRRVQAGQDPETVDAAITTCLNHTEGPLGTADRIGLDTTLDTLGEMSQRRGAAYAPPDLLRQMVSQGRLGRKSGEGFFVYSRARSAQTSAVGTSVAVGR